MNEKQLIISCLEGEAEAFKEEDITSPFQIKYIRIYDKPARTYLFQLQDSNMIIIWAEKNI